MKASLTSECRKIPAIWHAPEELVTEETAWKIYTFYAYNICEDIIYDIQIHWHLHRHML